MVVRFGRFSPPNSSSPSTPCVKFPVSYVSLGGEGETERGREGERERGREGQRDRGREGERERGREGRGERGRGGECGGKTLAQQWSKRAIRGTGEKWRFARRERGRGPPIKGVGGELDGGEGGGVEVGE